MSYTADQLITLASSLNELATDLLEKTAKKKEDKKSKPKGKFPFWLKNKTTQDTNEAEDKKQKTETTHKEWERITPRMKDWSDKDWSKYLNKDKKDTNQAKDKKKLDPKAKVRNRGDVVFSAESSNVNDNKDHFPLNSEDQARNALSQVAKYDKVPPWYKGSLKSLQDAVSRKVRSKYKEIGKDKKKSSVTELSPNLLTKYSEGTSYKT